MEMSQVGRATRREARNSRLMKQIGMKSPVTRSGTAPKFPNLDRRKHHMDAGTYLTSDGLQGSSYVKEVCEGATLIDVLREKYYVKTFQYFSDYQSDFDQHLVSENIDAKSLSFEAIQSLIGQGMSQVEEERTEIFGDPEEDPIFTEQRAGMEEAKDKGFFGSLADSFTGKSAKQAKYEKTEQQVTAEEAKRINEQIRADNDRLRRVVEEAPGAFNSHIGYAPLLKADANPENSLRNNVLFAGKGEMGRMMGEFMQNSIMNAKEHRGTST